jgi:hypothetical protein
MLKCDIDICETIITTAKDMVKEDNLSPKDRKRILAIKYFVARLKASLSRRLAIEQMNLKRELKKCGKKQ